MLTGNEIQVQNSRHVDNILKTDDSRQVASLPEANGKNHDQD